MQQLDGEQKGMRTTTHCQTMSKQFILLFCCSYQLSETEVKAKELSEEVAAIIQKQCSCNFLSEDLTSPTLQCPTSNPDTSNEVLFRACVLKAKDNHLPYSNVTTYLEEARGTSFSFKVKGAQKS